MKPEEFDFSVVHHIRSLEKSRHRKKEKSCGSVGCFIGHMPGAFPEYVEVELSGGMMGTIVPLDEKLNAEGAVSDWDYIATAQHLFNFSYLVAGFLFTPEQQPETIVKEESSFANWFSENIVAATTVVTASPSEESYMHDKLDECY